MSFELLLVGAAAPLVVAYGLACLRDPLRWALVPYAVLIPFSSLISVGPGPFGSVSSLLGLLLGVALVGQLVTNRSGSQAVPLAVPVWLAFLALSGLSLFWSVAPRASADSFLVLASLILLFVALVLTRFDRVTLRRFERGIELGGVLVVLYGVAQLLVLGGGSPFGEAARFGDDLLGPNNQAASLLLPIAISAGRTLTSTGRSRLLHGGATLLMLFGVIMTGSRGGLLAVLVVLGTIGMLGAARVATRVGLAAAATVTLLIVLLVNPAGVGERQLNRADSSSGRAEIWTVALHACEDYCLTGAGWGGFPTVYRSEQAAVPEARVLRQGTSYQPHNVFVQAGIELGVLGLVLVVVGLGSALVSAIRLPAAHRGPPVAALLGSLVSSFFLSNVEFKFFWAVLAYVVIQQSVAASEQRAAGPRTTLGRGQLIAVGNGER